MAIDVKNCLRSNLLTLLLIAGVFGGTTLGIALRHTSTVRWTQREVMYLQFPGDLFLRMLKLLIIPLLVSSVIGAVGGLDLSLSKKIALRSILFYATTTFAAVVLGIILVVTIRPGSLAREHHGQDDFQVVHKPREVLTVDTLMDLIRNLFPPNLVQATLSQSQTKLFRPANWSNETRLEDYDFKETQAGTTNVLGLIVFAIILGVSLGMLGDRGKPLLAFFDALSEAMMVITSWVIWLSPMGVFFLVAAKVMETENFVDLAGRLGLYFLTVLLGLLIHGFGSLALLHFILTRSLPYRFMMKLSQVYVTAFGTASSSATMPLTIQTLDQVGLDPRVTRFVIPVGSTINMDGTALYEAVAPVFIAQFRDIPLSFGQIIAVSITATFASIGAAGIPQAGLVTMVMVLDACGLPADDGALIIAVDWLLDRFRTTINVIGDTIAARVINELSRGELSQSATNAVSDYDKTHADPHELTEFTKTVVN